MIRTYLIIISLFLFTNIIADLSGGLVNIDESQNQNEFVKRELVLDFYETPVLNVKNESYEVFSPTEVEKKEILAKVIKLKNERIAKEKKHQQQLMLAKKKSFKQNKKNLNTRRSNRMPASLRKN